MSSTISNRMVRSILERTITGDANSVKTTFSSWDNCMAKAYCKWPVIAGIIVGSLIILGILGCLISCLCCGYQCCKGCCGCCYSCCDCGGSRHDRGASKYADSSYNNRHQPQQAPYYQQPPPPEPMNFGYRQPPPAAASSLSAAGPPPSYRGPSTATFDQPSKTAHVHVNEDELPPMPTWADAQTRRVENHGVEQHEAVEMDNLEGIRDHAKSPLHNGQQANGIAQAGPLSRGISRGGYTEVPVTYPSPRHSPRPAYDEGYSSHGHAGGNFAPGQGGAVSRGANLGENDGYFDQHGDQGPPYGSHAVDTHYFNQSPHSPGPQSPEGYGGGYGAPGAGSAPGYAPRRPPQQSSAPYRGFENQPPPRVQVPNFSGPRAYDQSQSPRSPPAMGSGFPPYGQQQHSQQARSPPPGSAGYSPYDLHDQQSQESELNPHQQHQQHYYDQASSGQYTPFSSRITSPPPSHSQQPPQYQATHLPGDWDHQSGNNDERPPSLLMVGRRPAPNTFRGV